MKNLKSCLHFFVPAMGIFWPLGQTWSNISNLVLWSTTVKLMSDISSVFSSVLLREISGSHPKLESFTTKFPFLCFLFEQETVNNVLAVTCRFVAAKTQQQYTNV